jgi:transcriptional regulator with XRE-family HTH domain
LNQVSSFSTQLKELRRRKGMTIADLAASAGVSRPTIWSWESARSKPPRSSLAALAAALGVSEPEVLGEAASKAIAIPLDERQRPPEELPRHDDAETLIEAINRAKDQIARLAGTEPDRVRIIIEI